MRSRQGPAPGDGVAVDEQLIDGDLEVTERSTNGGSPSLERPDAHAGRGTASIDDVLREQLVEDVERSFRDGLLGPAPHQLLDARSIPEGTSASV